MITPATTVSALLLLFSFKASPLASKWPTPSGMAYPVAPIESPRRYVGGPR